MDFRQSLAIAQERSDCRVLAYAAMSNHLHLVVEAGEEPLARFMQRFLGALAWRVNRRLGQSGAMVGGRYRALLVDRERYLAQLLAYVHGNPLRAGCARSIWSRRWTSAGAYLEGDDPVVRSDWACSLLGTDPSNLREAIDAFDGYARSRDPVLALDGQSELERRCLRLEREQGQSLSRSVPFLGGERLRRRILEQLPAAAEVLEAGDGLEIVVSPGAHSAAPLASWGRFVLQDFHLLDWGGRGPGRPSTSLRQARWVALTGAVEGLGVDLEQASAAFRLSLPAARRNLQDPASPDRCRRRDQLLQRWRARAAAAGPLNNQCLTPN